MNGRILVVDDDAAIRKVLGIGLTGSGYETRVAASGAEALDLLHQGDFRPDCILTDIRMPGLPGDRLLEAIKRELPLVPVIMLTALNQVEVAVDTMRKGAFDYLLKPVRKAHLEETVRKALRFRELQLENERLLRENQEYQRSLERKVQERTAELKQANLETVKMAAETIEAKDPYTHGHCGRVRLFSSRIAAALGLAAQEGQILEYGALLHDIGKIGVPEALLHKNGPLEEQERKVVETHPVVGAGIVSTVKFFRSCLPIVRNHHERFDGRGYPDGLRGEQIDLKARIAAVADAFDAMTSSRPYRPAMSAETALKEMLGGRGSQFDPDIVDVFVGRKLYRE